MSSEKQSRITAEDLYRLQLVGDAQISPDGQHVVYLQQWVDEEAEKKVANLWIAPVEGGEAQQFTRGEQRDRHPRWSPDGKQIAFLSNRSDEKQEQIFILPFSGGEARQLTDLKGEFAEFAWSPEGAKLALQFRKKDEEVLEREADEQKKKLGPVMRRITRPGFRENGRGYLPHERWHIWTVDVNAGEATQLTDGEYDEVTPRWSADAGQILFVSNRSEDPDFNPDLDDLYVMPASGGDLQKLETPTGRKSAPTVSPDGRWLSYVGRRLPNNWWQNNDLWLLPLDGSAPARNLTGRTDLHVASVTLGDVADRPFSNPVWSPDSSRVFFQVTRHGNTCLKSVSLQGQLEEELAPDGVISSFSLDARGRRAAYIRDHFGDPGQVWIQEMDSGQSRQLTHVNEQWLDECDLGQIEEIWFEGGDGNDVQGWILKPPGFEPQKKYPLIMEIHGGPWSQYGKLFMHEFYFLAARGYVIAFCNPRGSQGYGEDHSRAIWQEWGNRDYADLMAWADFLQELPYVDEGRMGLAGGSYGGYMTLWIVGHTQRFKAAVAQRVVSNAISFWGSSDFGYLYEDPWAGGDAPWENLEKYWEQSPMKHIGNVQTPTLLIHSEQDLRCNLEQAAQAFLALKRKGVDTELILFPEESHGLSRDGRTDRRVARLQQIGRWFDNYL